MERENIIEAERLYQEIRQLEEHSNFLKEQTKEMDSLHKGLENINNNIKIIASIGKGIHTSAKIESDILLVEVGAGFVIKKSKEEVKELIEKQIENMRRTEIMINQQIEVKENFLEKIISELNEKRKEE